LGNANGGGGIFNQGGLTLSNSTVSSNVAGPGLHLAATAGEAPGRNRAP
jgi:hypothetical protein